MLSKEYIESSRREGGTRLIVRLNEKGRYLVRKFLSVVKRLREIETRKSGLLTKLRSIAKYQAKRSGKTGYRNAVLLDGGDDNQVLFIFQHRYSKIGTDKRKKIKEIVGALYDDMFEVKEEVKLKRTALADKEFMDKLTQLCGGKIKKYFVKKRWVEPKTNFTKTRRKVLTASQNKKLDRIVRQSEPRVETDRIRVEGE